MDNRLEIKIQNEYEYHSLSPTDDADKDGHYSHALSWALRNSDKIKNIAMAGPYGSGKSSILQTFIKNNKNHKLKFLNISLATFREGDDIEDSSKKKLNNNEDDLLRLIELSILQQIIFHEKDSRLPDSRLVKIKNYSKNKLVFHALWFMFIVALLVYDQFPDIFSKITQFDLPKEIEPILHIVFLISWSTTIFFILCKILRILKVFRLIKLVFKNAEIEINDNVNKSILNNHLDEILYFFEVTQYNVVIIEDLDRFQQTDVFTKLREINLLVNSSKKIKRNVVFIYAIKDDMFRENERTKFFDFVVPVIPVINTSNSSEILFNQRNLYFKGEISDEIIENVSYFIDDMRLLFNILNEYNIYRQKLGDNINKDKLFAIIVYKNLFPNDFVKLCNNDGKLLAIISQKGNIILQKTKEIDKEINFIRSSIDRAENTKLNNIRELRALYVFQYVADIKNRIVAFHINNHRYNFEDVLTDELFDFFVNDQIQYYSINVRNYSLSEAPSGQNVPKFQDMEKKLNAEHTYEQRKTQIETHTIQALNELKEKIRLKEQEKIDIRHIELSVLFDPASMDKDLKNTKQGNVISVFLQNGYIDENYYDYVSLFHESSITRSDYAFLLNVKNRKYTDFDYKLIKIENLIKKISRFDFSKSYILNLSLIDFFLDNNTLYNIEKNAIFAVLSDESTVSISFIDEFIESGKNIELFINELSKNWKGFWNYIDTKSAYTSERKLTYYGYIIKFATVEAIENIAQNSTLRKMIESDVEFCNQIADVNKTKRIIQTFNIKFFDISNILSDEVKEFIYKGSHYQINSKNIECILDFKKQFDHIRFDSENYSEIKQSSSEILILYIDNNISEYVEMVYLNGINESEDSLVLLLNNKNVNNKQKELMIKIYKKRISSLNRIEDIGIKKILLTESRVDANWGDIINVFHEEENILTEEIIKFISDKENIQKLTKEKIKEDIPDNETIQAFCKSLALCGAISNDNYSLILNSIPYYYNSLEYGELSKEKVLLLLKKSKLGLSSDNFKKLKESYSGLHITLLENEFEQLIEKWNEIPLGYDDYLSLLNSGNISLENKGNVCDKIGDEAIITKHYLLDAVGMLVFENTNFSISIELLQAILLNSSLDNQKKMKIFNEHSFRLNTGDFISSFLLKIGYPYNLITQKGKRPKIAISEKNLEFVKKLKENGYISHYDSNNTYIRVYTYRT
jgi:hypothetical protein